MPPSDTTLMCMADDPTLCGALRAVDGSPIRLVGRSLAAAIGAQGAAALSAWVRTGVGGAPGPAEAVWTRCEAGSAQPRDVGHLWLVGPDDGRALLCVSDPATDVWREVEWVDLGTPVDWARVESRASWGPYMGVRTPPERPAHTSPLAEVRVVDGEQTFWVEIMDEGGTPPTCGGVCDCGIAGCRHVARALKAWLGPHR